jgi:nucleotide-binding universal stress UspA family protein
MKTILVPVDLSRASARVCTVASALAKSLRGRLVLLHVVPPQTVALRAPGFATAEVRGMLAALEKRSAVELLELGRGLKKSRRPVRTVQVTGDPVPTILRQAAEMKADLIVMGSHGQSAAYDLLVGSNTHRVLRRTKWPVLVVPIGRPAAAG